MSEQRAAVDVASRTAPEKQRAPGNQRARRPAARRMARVDAAIGLGFISPVLIGVIAFGLVPFGFVIWYSFHDWNPLVGTFDFAGLENYRRLVSDPVVWGSLGRTLQFAILLMVMNISLAMVLALLLNTKMRGITTFRAFFFSPMVVSTVAWVLVWSYLGAANGGVNGVLSMIGIEGPNWFQDSRWALFAIAVVQVFKGVGMNMILFLAALQGVPGELKEAAQIDGAGPVRSFFSITLPLITPTILLVTILTMIGSLDLFAPVQILTEGGPGRSTMVMSYLLYKTAFQQQNFGYGSAIGVLLFVVILVLTAIQWGARKKWVVNEV